MTETRKVQFRAYAPGRTAYPVTIVTPEDGFYIHTFFDVRPWSPFGNSLACLKLPFQDRLPGPDDTATVCIIDLKEQTITEVGETKGWGMQVGAHVCWGSDNLLYYNDKEGCEVFAVEYNVTTREKRRMAGSIYFMAPDGSYFLSPSLSLINASQNGYGATMPDGRVGRRRGDLLDLDAWRYLYSFGAALRSAPGMERRLSVRML
jgi:hypothetical protein